MCSVMDIDFALCFSDEIELKPREVIVRFQSLKQNSCPIDAIH